MTRRKEVVYVWNEFVSDAVWFNFRETLTRFADVVWPGDVGGLFVSYQQIASWVEPAVEGTKDTHFGYARTDVELSFLLRPRWWSEQCRSKIGGLKVIHVFKIICKERKGVTAFSLVP